MSSTIFNSSLKTIKKISNSLNTSMRYSAVVPVHPFNSVVQVEKKVTLIFHYTIPLSLRIVSSKIGRKLVCSTQAQ